MKLSKAFRLGAEMIDQPGKWVQNKYGFDVGFDAYDDGRYCMLGGAAKASLSSPYALYDYLPIAWAFLDYNDAPDTTQSDAVLGSLIVSEYLRGLGK